GEQSFFCVGDTKQEIYGWRGGAAQIFETLEESFSVLQRTAERRDESRRSALPIIQTVNKVFSSLAQAQSLVEYPAVVEAWKSRFQEHTTALTELPGYVELRAVAAVSEDSDISDDILAAAADLVCELHSKNPQASIAVLLRGNDAVSRMLGKLWDRHVRASGEGGNPLTDSWYVGLVLSTLRLAEHPGDTISAYLIHNSALGKSLGLQDYASRTELEALSLRLRSEIEVEGLGEVIRGWVVLLSKEAPAHDRRRLRQLVELAYAYNYSRANRLNDFITWVKMTPVENPAASHVRVMTIHKSKGLEFDAVVLPELNGRVPKSLPSSLLRLQPDPVAAPTLVSRYADQYVRNLEPRLAEMHEQAKGREVEEALSVLYVALTRARSQLYMLVDSAASKSLSFASLLRETLAPSAATEEILFSHGEKDSWQALRPANEAGTRTIQAPAAVPTLAASTSGTRRGVVQEVSRSTTGHSVDLAALMQLESDESSLRSSVLRRLIRSIEWLGEDVPTVEELAAQTHLELDENPTMHSLVGEFASTLKKPEIRQAFQANDPQLESTLQRALPFAFRHEGTTVAGVFPRLELSIKKGKVVAARVFEFDIEENSCKDGAEALLERRRAQLEMYRRAAAHFCDLPEKDISVVLVCLGEGRCITLENATPKTKANRRG
ncbi:MAG: UvrD-helicase domain-containing protein, partial [Deltaproteobacteria bacterium]|nr:UvrD-helicase domain-containing protein [Deltaproteobacteria bacterium]